MIRFIIDESVDMPIAKAISDLGCEIVCVSEMNPGISDETVLSLANEKGAFLLTADKDFGELVFRKGLVFQGIVLIRLPGVKPADKAAIVADCLRDHLGELSGAFSVISDGGLRIRQPRSKRA